MQFGVDESALKGGAVAVDGAATAVAAIRVDSLSRSVAAAMPGSRSSGLAATVGELLDAVVQGIVRDLVEHAEAVGTAGLWYGDTEQGVVSAAGRRAEGAA
jgi:hypothetical protein